MSWVIFEPRDWDFNGVQHKGRLLGHSLSRSSNADPDDNPLIEANPIRSPYPGAMRRLTPSTTLPYLMVLVLGVVGGRFFDYAFYQEPVLFGQTFGLLFQVSSTFVALLLWLPVQNREKLNGLALAIFGTLAILWILITIHARLDNSAFNYSALTTPLILLMIIWKPPTRTTAWRLADFSFALLALTAVLAQLLDTFGIRDPRMLDTRWSLPLLDFDLGFRWEGFFGDPNNAGFIGAALVVYGLHRFGSLRIALATVGLAIVVFSESRTALLALAAGLIITFVTSRYYISRQIRPVLTIGLLTAALVFGASLVWIMDSSLNGRVDIWKAFVELFASAPFSGVGWSGINLAAETSRIPWQNSDGHNVAVDAFARHGLIVGILVTGVLAASMGLAFKVRLHDDGTTLSVLTVWLMGALTYTVTTWQNLNVLLVPFILMLLLAASLSASDREPAR